MHLEGRGVPRSYEKAYLALRQAAETSVAMGGWNGVGEVYFYLGKLLAGGRGGWVAGNRGQHYDDRDKACWLVYGRKSSTSTFPTIIHTKIFKKRFGWDRDSSPSC